MTIVDPYTILGIQKTASNDEIRRAFNALSERLNPTRNPHKAAGEQFKELRSAFELLTDPVQKRRYDDSRLAAEANPVFTLRTTPSKRTISSLGEEQVMYLLAEITPPANATQVLQAREIQINLTLVIDQSKSMEDENRMDKVKAAAQTIITDLTNNDVLSIITFNDRADVIIPATRVQDKMALRARVGMIKPKGATAIFEGLNEGIKQTRKNLSPNMVNHIILLTDGRTYGDEEKCLDLARRAALEGITISAMGLGSDWNDKFLDQLASITGGTSTYIRSVNMVSKFLDNQLRSLSSSFAERMQISIAPEPDVKLEMVFKLSPQAQQLEHSSGVIPLSGLPAQRPITLLIQVQLSAAITDGQRPLARIVASGDVMVNGIHRQSAVDDITIKVATNIQTTEEPPASIIDALSKLTLYRLQEKAQEAMERGDIEEATRRLQFLATRLIDMGEETLGRQALAEADHVMKTRAFSNEASKKTIKYSTRALVDQDSMRDALTALFDSQQDS